MIQKNNLRQHVTLAIVTLILAAALLALMFIPRQPTMHQFQGPSDGPGNTISPGTSMPFIQAAQG